MPLQTLHRQLGLVTWLLAMGTIQIALTHPAVRRPYLTSLWQAGVWGVTGLMLLLAAVFRPTPAKLAAGPEDALSKTV